MSGFRSQHFSLRHRVIAFISTRIVGNFVYTMRHGLAAGMRRKGGLGFLGSRALSAEERFLSNLDFAGKSVYDIGAFEGLVTLFFARKAASVITYEPNPRNYRLCVQNVELNGLSNVQVLQRGISSKEGYIGLAWDPLMPGAGSGNLEIASQITSSVKAARSLEIPVTTLDADFERMNLPRPDFIKIDIEGMELDALKGMLKTIRTFHPDLFIEMHGAEVPDKIRNTLLVCQFLEESGYSIYDVENQRHLTSATLDSHPPSHLYCKKV